MVHICYPPYQVFLYRASRSINIQAATFDFKKSEIRNPFMGSECESMQESKLVVKAETS
jgi:hypothetical protein